jgi:KDO2-lipid IV(A) lauroyltransferase
MLTLFRLLGGLPLRILHAVGAAIGWLTYVSSAPYRQRFEDNARQAGVPRAVARHGVAAAGRMVAELPYLWLRPAQDRLGPQLHWQGSQLLRDALSSGRGVVLLTPHLGSFEVTAQAIAQDYAAEFGPITVLYRPARKEVLRRWMDRSRARAGVETAPATLAGVRQMMRALRGGRAVGLLPDQVPPLGMGVWAPFFGKPAYTMTLAARLVQTGAVPLLIWGERLSRGQGYTVRVRALDGAQDLAHASQAESAAAINRAMERLILECPQQYLWGYNRYKSPRSADPAD